MRTVRKLVLVMLVIAGAVLGIQAPALAVEAPGNIAIHNQGDSDAHLDVQMRQTSGAIYEINLYPGYTAGEGFGSGDEAYAWYDRVGWCYKTWYTSQQGSRVYTSPISGRYFPATEGHWHIMYPGTLYEEDQWITYVKVWNC